MPRMNGEEMLCEKLEKECTALLRTRMKVQRNDLPHFAANMVYLFLKPQDGPNGAHTSTQTGIASHLIGKNCSVRRMTELAWSSVSNVEHRAVGETMAPTSPGTEPHGTDRARCDRSRSV